VYLKKGDAPQPTELDLLHPSDLKGLALKDVQDPQRVELCRLKDGDRVFVIQVTEVPKGCVLVTSTSRMMYTAYHAIVCYELKAQMVQVALSFAAESSEQGLLFKLLGVMERIFARGRESKSWITTTDH
jgi:hypothetical protein